MITHANTCDALAHNRVKRGINRLLSPTPAFALHRGNTEQRNRVEQYIAAQFNQCYDAQIHNYMPWFLTMSCRENYSAVAGICPAQADTLFLEQYLDEPIETVLSRVDGTTVDRQHITEIGNLVATQRGSSQLLFLVLASIIHRCGFSWVTFTMTTQVQKTLTRLGIKLHILGRATASALETPGAANWGSYYDHNPQVAAAKVDESIQKLNQKHSYPHIVSLYRETIAQFANTMNQE